MDDFLNYNKVINKYTNERINKYSLWCDVLFQIPCLWQCFHLTKDQISIAVRMPLSAIPECCHSEVPLHRPLTCRADSCSLKSIGIHWRREHIQGLSLMHNKDNPAMHIVNTRWRACSALYTTPAVFRGGMSSHGKGVGNMHRVKIHRELYMLYLIYLYCFTECALFRFTNC